MSLAIFIPENPHKVPVIFCLGGLTSTYESFPTKTGYQRKAAELQVAIVCPDTSPRGEHVHDDEDPDLGASAGWYVNTTKSPWRENYQMFDYITKELPKLLTIWSEEETDYWLDTSRMSIMGYSMGGHGSIICFLKTNNIFTSCSAFAPVVSASHSAFGIKAFTQYFESRSEWQDYDACQLVKEWSGDQKFLLIDVGADDEYLDSDIMHERLKTACEGTKIYPQVNVHAGFNHSYYFVASFIEAHIEFHSQYLCKSNSKSKKKRKGCI